MHQKIIAIAAGFTLATFAAVGAFASQDQFSTQEVTETPTDVATETATEAATEVATETPTENPTETPVSSETPTESETPTPSETPTGTETPVSSETPTETDTPAPTDTVEPSPTAKVRGIPDSNPVKGDDDGDGECEKHETVIKTTPSGNQVRVPCHAGNGGSGGGKKP